LCFLEGKRTSIMGQVIYFLSLSETYKKKNNSDG